MSSSASQQPGGKRRTFSGDEAAPLDLRTAARWTATERRQHPDQVNAYFFGRKIIELILAQPGCVGLRVHYATDPATGQRHLLITGADAHQNDQLPPLTEPARLAAPAKEITAAEAINFLIAEMAIPCPNQCGDGNLLNGGKS